MYDEYDDGSGGRSPIRIIATVVGVLAILAAGWFLVKPRIGGSDDNGGNAAASSTSVAEAAADAVTTTAEADGEDAATTTEADASESADAPTTTERPETTAPATTAATTTVAPTPTTAAAPVVPADPGYPVLADGSPAPIVAIFGYDQITLTGAVPDQAAVDRLAALAIANSKFDVPVANFLTINPNVPLTVPVRVVELTSTRFPENSAEILPEHALELDRVVSIMHALPNISVVIVGHADARGDELTNFAISDERARAVFNYLVAGGITPSRIASRAVGEEDLLTLNNDDAANELNRRTEVIFTGLLAP
jgi:outer membrane protein OmpA-like peptidoglycan-associated protein